MIQKIFKSKAEVIAFVSSLGIEEAILLGNLWLEVKNKVTALEQSEIIASNEAEKLNAVFEKEREVLENKGKEIKSLQDSISAKEALILDKENEIQRWTLEVSKKDGEKEHERNISKEELNKKEEEVRQCKLCIQKKEEELSEMRLQFNGERQELKLDKDRAIEDMRIRNAQENEENAKKIIHLQSYITAKDEELTKTRSANENFIMNKFEVTFGRFIEKAKTSAGTGLMGEEFVQQILSKENFGFHYENVARWGHQGDFKIIFPKSRVTILLEVKNFAETNTSLPKKDLDKFFMDLKDSNYHAGILLSLNSQCKMGIEDLCIQDDPKSKKKFLFLSRFISSVKGDHDFILKLALNVLANAVEASRTNQDDVSKEMLTFIKSQLDFMRAQFKAAQAAEREAGKTVNSLRDNINKITRQMYDWEAPQRRRVPEGFDQSSNSPFSKNNDEMTLPTNEKAPSYGILAQPLSRPNSPWEIKKSAYVNKEAGALSSPKTPTSSCKRTLQLDERKEQLGTPEKVAKSTLSSPFKLLATSSSNVQSSTSSVSTNFNSGSKATSSVDDHGFLRFPNLTYSKSVPSDAQLTCDSKMALPNDTDELFKDMCF